MNIAEVTTRVLAHSLQVAITDKGDVKYSIDGNEMKHAKTIRDGKIIFIGSEELVVKGELQEFEFMQLPPKDYEMLESVRLRVLKDMAAEKSLEQVKKENKDDILKRVDKWSKRVRKYKKDGVKKTYAVHNFIIGAQSYRFFERNLKSEYSRDGILINPVYSVRRGLPGGAVPIKRGELVFWLYYTEEDGWNTIRELTLNEIICTEIIRAYGMVATGKI